MSDVAAISPVNIVSSYTRVTPSGPNETVTHIKHTQQEGGPIKIQTVSYTTYNVRGEEIQSPKPVGSNLDMMI
tara:strand:- start:90 stop:308 length:219 start_codon:yes stop_codon:yes gene_type:complete